MNKGPYILLRSGDKAYFDSPDELRIDDIAHSLSLLCRFTGHTTNFYSVAQHSVLVSRMLPPKLRLTGLLHDAAEAVLGDVSSPLKSCLEGYRYLQDTWEKALAEQYGLVYPFPDIVHQADLVALATERRDFMPEDDDPWPILEGVIALPTKIDYLPPKQAKQLFLDAYAEYT